MQRTLTAIIATVILAITCDAQAPTMLWQTVMGGTNNDTGTSVALTSDGGSIVSSWTWSMDGDVAANAGNCDYWMVKLDMFGGMQWKMNYGGTDWENAWMVSEAANGDYLVTGWTQSMDGDVSATQGSIDVWVMRVDPLGNLVWENTYGGTEWERGNVIREKANGNILFVARTRSWNGQVTGHHGNYDYWVVELDPNGNLNWQRALGGSGDDQAFAMDICADGGVIVGGFTTSSDGDVPGAMGSYDCWVVKLDALGNLIWGSTYGGSGNDQVWDIHETADGGYIFAGLTGSTDNDVAFNNGAWDIWLVKLDANGNLIWESTFGGSGNDWGRSVVELPDGRFALAGFTASADGDVSDNQGDTDAWVLLVDANGGLLWEETYGGSLTEYANSIERCSTGGLLVAGTASSTDGDVVGLHGGMDVWVFKLSELDILPVELLSFEAMRAQQAVQLDWTTASEQDNAGFHVQRSSDATQFLDIGFVPGLGNSASTTAYRYVDESPEQGINYYRLKQVDTDGNSTYSAVRAVEFRAGSEIAWVEHMGGFITIHFQGDDQDGSEWRLLDASGKRIASALVEGRSLRFAQASLSSGIYVLRSPGDGITHRFHVTR